MEPQVDPAAAALVASILGKPGPKPVYRQQQQQLSQKSQICQDQQSLVEGFNSSFNSRNSRNSRSVSFKSINSRNSLLEGFPSNSVNTPSSLPPPITITPIPIPASPSPSAPALSTPAPCTPAATLQTCPISNPIPSATTTFYSTSTKSPSNSSASLILHSWNPPPPFFRYNDLQPTPLSEPRALVLLFHGLGGHAQFPTVRYLAELLAGPTANCVVYALDLEGHGMSGGKRGFVRSANSCIEDGMQAARLAVRAGQGQGTVRDLPFFIAGTSMGAAIALNVAHRLSISADASIAVTGVLSLAPMIAVKIPKWQQGLVRTVSKIAPSVSLLPGYSSKNSSRNNSKKNVFKEEDSTQDHPPSKSRSQSPNDEALAGCTFRDPKRRSECLADTLSYSGSLRSASAHACIKLTKKIKQITSLLSPQIPQLLLLAGDDCVVDNQSSIDYYSSCPSLDKTLKIYEGALHGLMCEPLPLRQEIEGDIVTWIVERSENFRKSRKTGVPAKSQEMRAAFLQDLENALEILEDDSDDEEEEFSNSYHEEGGEYDACFYNNY
mmetsp:Transcript_13119/g.15054  ORF Transcript_13119/g.15054 Transcript_13119/m.15054 type:complete len:552 (+) Transcript_13119:147-1802(+)